MSTLPQNSDAASLPSAGTGATALATESGVPWAGFALAADAVVRHLQARFGWDLWLVGHGRADHTVVVASAGPWQTSARPGERFQWPWSEPTPTAGMAVPLVDPPGPPAQAAPGRLASANTHIGIPLLTVEGTQVGALCGLTRTAHPPAMEEAATEAALLGRMLSTIRAGEQAAADRSSEAAAAYALATQDGLTGLLNRRGWDAAVAVEEGRARRYGRAVSAIVVDLDGLKQVNDTHGHEAGNSALVACGRVLTELCRPGDATARIGGDEFAVLAVECDVVSARALTVRLREVLRSAGVAASVGSATQRRGEALRVTVERADRAMYQARRHRTPVTALSGALLPPVDKDTPGNRPPMPPLPVQRRGRDR